jgi:hypothetical protein
MKKTARRLTLVLGIASIGILGLNSTVAAKMYHPSLAELTRDSKQIITGTVLKISNSALLFRPIKTHKGVAPAKPLEVELPRGNIELYVPDYKLGNTVLLFTKSTSAVVVPNSGPDGLLVLRADLAAQYETAINKILEYDVSTSTAQRREHLYAMLKGNSPLLKRVAMWDFIYINRDARKENLVDDSVLPLLRPIALGRDSSLANLATQTIGRIGGPESIPILEQIQKSSNHNAADIAAKILRRQGR